MRMIKLIAIWFLLVLSLNTMAQDTQITINTVSWSPDGRFLAVGGSELSVYYSNLTPYKTFEISHGIITLEWSPDGSQIAAETYAEFGVSVTVWDINNEQPLFVTPDNQVGSTGQLDWSPNGEFIATSVANWISVIDAETGEEVKRLSDENRTGNVGMLGLQWSADSSVIYALADFAAKEEFLKWDVALGQVISGFSIGDKIYPFALAVSPDESQIAIAVVDQTNDTDAGAAIYIYDVNTGSRLKEIEIPRTLPEDRRLNNLIWAHEGNYLIGSTYNGEIYVWDVSTEQLIDNLYSITSSTTQLTDIALSHYGGQVAIGTVPLNVPLPEGIQAESFLRHVSDGAVKIVVPAPSVERLNAIADECIPPNTTSSIAVAANVRELPNFIMRIEALPDEDIPAGCRADLLAVAEALIEEDK